MATYSTSALVVGSHNLTATYSGDPTYAGSTSTVLTQTVNQVVATSHTLLYEWTFTNATIQDDVSAQLCVGAGDRHAGDFEPDWQWGRGERLFHQRADGGAGRFGAGDVKA